MTYTESEIAEFEADLQGAITREASNIEQLLLQLIAKGWPLHELMAFINNDVVGVVPTFAVIDMFPNMTALQRPPEPGSIHVMRMADNVTSFGWYHYSERVSNEPSATQKAGANWAS